MQSALAMLLLDAPLIALMIAVITRTTAERFRPCLTSRRIYPSQLLKGRVAEGR